MKPLAALYATRAPIDLAELEQICIHDGDCWLWPGAVDGGSPSMRLPRPQPVVAGVYGAKTKVTREVWAWVHGKALPAGWVAYRTCHSARCVAPEHVICVTRPRAVQLTAEAGRLQRRPDQRERHREGALRSGLCKLTPEQALEIRNARYRESAADLAICYGVDRSLIYAIWHGKAWATGLHEPAADRRPSPPTVFEWAQAGGRRR